MKYILIVFVTSLLIGCKRNAVATSYYFPYGFEGEFVIVYGQKKGCPEKHEKGRRQLYIPDNGVLVTQFKFSDGFRNDLFYIQNQQGEYEPVKEFVPDKAIKIGWEFDTATHTTEKNIRSVRRGTRAEIYSKNKDVYVVESGAFMNEEESDASGLTRNVLSDAVFRQIETERLIIHCR